MTKTLILNSEIIEQLNDMVFYYEKLNLKYFFEASNSSPLELRLNVFENNEWINELSNVFHLGEEINSEYEPWVEWIMKFREKQA